MESESPMLGAGLIGIGREWGHVKTDIPSEEVDKLESGGKNLWI